MYVYQSVFKILVKNVAMNLPKLLPKDNIYILRCTQQHLQKYRHLLQWKPDASIMECGFGTGENSVKSLIPLLPQDYIEFVGSDISKHRLQTAKRNIYIPRFATVELDIITKHIPRELQNRFDHIFGFFVIDVLHNPRQAFRNFHTMLKPGGSVFLNFFERIPVDGMFHNLRSHPKWGKYRQEDAISVYYYTQNPKEEYRKDIEAAGFKNYVYNDEIHHHVFKSEEECRDLHTSVNPILHNIPKEEYDEYIEDYIKEKENTPIFRITYENGKRTISAEYKMFVFHATKNV
ncbi:juvenile hormone acid O-methyltransferase-like isoform X1 [Diabrotica undecimpunctata]|uniref:juvenile hormone acid O-methyltransferase-like isoform X1 n=1 Tax=Diabrotica undecimpunctata TaxID=50387 RepID=UPI003B63FDE5